MTSVVNCNTRLLQVIFMLFTISNGLLLMNLLIAIVTNRCGKVLRARA